VGRVAVTTLIEAPVERVFELWTDAACYPKWFPHARRISNVSAPLDQRGARYTLHLEGPVRAKCQVTRVERNRFHEHIFRQTPFPAEGQAVAKFEPAEGGTRLSFDASYEVAGGPVGRFLDRLLIARVAEPRMAQEIANFKRLIEQG
jgi:uncharacterized protein YndB with AHSA1/START domain